MKFTARFRSVGNPDMGQYAPVSNPELATADTLRGVVAAWDAYVHEWDLGGGNCPRMAVKLGRRTVAHLSYNGRLWHPSRKRPLSATSPHVMVEDHLTDAEVASLNETASRTESQP